MLMEKIKYARDCKEIEEIVILIQLFCTYISKNVYLGMFIVTI